MSEETRSVGPKHPVLIRHQGQRPIVHFYAPVQLEMARMEVAVFDDGTLAFQGYRCGWGSAPTTTTLSEVELAALRDLVSRECFQLQSSNAYCTHSGPVRIRCSAGSRTMDLMNQCDSDHETRAWRDFADRVRRLLRIDERPPGEGVCSPPVTRFWGSEIELTISPFVIVNRTYGASPTSERTRAR